MLCTAVTDTCAPDSLRFGIVRALILDQCGNRAALPAARALKRDGWTVGIAACPGHELARHSRAVAYNHELPAPCDGADALVRAVNAAVAEQGYEVVFPLDDVGVLALSSRREQLHAVFPYGCHESVARVYDKLELVRNAKRVGMAAPLTELFKETVLSRFSGRPLLVKPRHTFVEGANGHVRAQIAHDRQEACEIARTMSAAGAEPLLQERVHGQLMAFIALAGSDARLLACVQQVTERMWPPDVGISARARTVAVEQQLAAAVAQLLHELGWSGLAQLQFIRGADGTPCLIDFNGRFYGSLALSLASGANLPAAWARLATGRLAADAPTDARVGARYQWLAADLRASAHSRGTPRRAAGQLGSLLLAPVSAHSIWSPRDPLPALARLLSRLTKWMPREKWALGGKSTPGGKWMPRHS